jgi:hypothetical protein
MHITKSLEQKKEECLALLRSTHRDKIEDLITHITQLGYFEAPGSLKHHRFVGGLVSHSLETYHKALQLRMKKIKEGFALSEMPDDGVIISALMHDLCKSDTLRYSHTLHRTVELKKTDHSARSVRLIGSSGFHLTSAEEDAILMHMGGKKRIKDDLKRKEHFKTHPLTDIIFWADKYSINESKRRHHPGKYRHFSIK